MSIYLELTRDFNEGRLRAIVSSGQAVVLHRLAVASKDGDWILREDPESLAWILGVLERHGSRYRFGAPLDVRWMRGGWSSHLEHRRGPLRVRTDFVTRPPRLAAERRAAMWREQAGRNVPFVGARDLATLKMTNREKDYPIIGELARRLEDPAEQLLYSRSARDIRALAERHPDLVARLAGERPLLGLAEAPREEIEAALDAERRRLIHANERRLARYVEAARAWRALWPAVAQETAGHPLREAHAVVVARAEGVLPFEIAEADA